MEIIRFECPKRCHLYSKSFEEIIEAGNKHRENVLALKDISEKQKVKLSSLREEKNVLLDKVDGLEHDKRKDSDLILRMTSETRSLKREVRDLRMILVEKEEQLCETIVKENAMEVLEMKCKDLEDEIVTKDIKISNFEDCALAEKNTEETLESELKHVGNDLKTYAAMVKVLDGDLNRIKEKESSDKIKRKLLFEKMDTLAQEREDEVEKLKANIKCMKQKTLPQCWHGKYCIRLFCKFDHRHVYTKVNIHLTKFIENKVEVDVPFQYLCEQCGNILQSQEEKENHDENCHRGREIAPINLKSFKCRECSFISESRADLNSHVISNHSENEIECEVCGKFFVTRSELKDHRKEHRSKPVVENDLENLNNLLKGLLNENEETLSENISKQPKSPLTFNCHICDEGFATKTSLKNHMKRKHNVYKKNIEKIVEQKTRSSEVYVPISKLKCEMCEIRFFALEKMDDHMDEQHGGRWKFNDPDVVMFGDDNEESEESVVDESEDSPSLFHVILEKPSQDFKH